LEDLCCGVEKEKFTLGDSNSLSLENLPFVFPKTPILTKAPKLERIKKQVLSNRIQVLFEFDSTLEYLPIPTVSWVHTSIDFYGELERKMPDEKRIRPDFSVCFDLHRFVICAV
jgi:hypothetical protein